MADDTNPPPEGLPEEWRDEWGHTYYGPQAHATIARAVMRSLASERKARLEAEEYMREVREEVFSSRRAAAAENTLRLEAEAELAERKANPLLCVSSTPGAHDQEACAGCEPCQLRAQVAQLTKERDQRMEQRDALANEALIALHDAGHHFTPGKPGQLAASVAALVKERDEARAFKAYVHRRLDQIGVPANPEPPKHALNGCRIGDRLDWIAAANARLRGLLREAREVAEDAVCCANDALRMLRITAPRSGSATQDNLETMANRAGTLREGIDAELAKSGGKKERK